MFSSDGSAEKKPVQSLFLSYLSRKKFEDISKQSKTKDFWYYKVHQELIMTGIFKEYVTNLLSQKV
jgi:hypothetical protein